jgi:FkbM family methyltransferase
MNSNTYLFYRKGSRGVCVEPNPDLCRLIKKVRPHDKCLNVGIGVSDNSVADFYSLDSHTLSTFSKADAQHLTRDGKHTIKEILKIPIVSINTIIRENFREPVDLISIDVEGWNEEIIESFDFNACRPFCFCVETINYTEDNLGIKLNRIFDVFKNNNYRIYADTHLNTIFLDNRFNGNGK